MYEKTAVVQRTYSGKDLAFAHSLDPYLLERPSKRLATSVEVPTLLTRKSFAGLNDTAIL